MLHTHSAVRASNTMKMNWSLVAQWLFFPNEPFSVGTNLCVASSWLIAVSLAVSLTEPHAMWLLLWLLLRLLLWLLLWLWGCNVS